MAAGRPQNSKTPAWRSTPAAKVRAYRFLMGDQGTKSDCAMVTGLTRKTVAHWWDAVEWTEENSQTFNQVQDWLSDCATYKNINPQRCADSLGISLKTAEYEMETLSYVSQYIR